MAPVGGKLVAASSSKVRVTWLAATPGVPTCDIIKVSFWFGATTSALTSCTEACVKLVKVTVTLRKTLPILLTLMMDGYGVAMARSLIMMAAGLAKVLEIGRAHVRT